MKKVIFVGGTAYSGSTFFDMTLANDPKGFSIGEVYALFYPFRKKHLDIDSLSNEIDWRAIKKEGPENLYQNIFSRFPEVDFIVDSSKSPLWISDRTRELKKQNVDVKNILIWKYPSEFQESKIKRGEERGWARAWVNYHQYYMEMVKDWRAVKYGDFAQNKDCLRRLCEILEIDYFEGKENFWDKKQHTLYGNLSAKIHLVDKDSTEFDKQQDKLKKEAGQEKLSKNEKLDEKHKKIYYDNSVIVQGDKFLNDLRFKQYIEILEYVDINQKDLNLQQIQKMLSPLRVDVFYKLIQIIKLKYLGHITNKL